MTTELSISQLRAIKRAVYLGRTLQGDFPGIAQDYRDGLSRPKIVEKYNIMRKYRVGKNIAEGAVAFALRGHDDNLGVKPYSGLITDRNELSRLGLEHQVTAMANSLTPEVRRSIGEKLYEKRLGLFALTHEQRVENSKKGGKTARDNGYGFHALTPEQKLENQRKATIASGHTLWTTEERNRALELAKHPDYQFGERGPCYQKIADTINEEFHAGNNTRTRSSINYLLFKGFSVIDLKI